MPKNNALRSDPTPSEEDAKVEKFWRFAAAGGFPSTFIIVVFAHVGDEIFDTIVDGLPLLDFLWKYAVDEAGRLGEATSSYIKPHSPAFEALMDFKINKSTFMKEAESIMEKRDILVAMIKHGVPIPKIKTAVEQFPYLFDFKRSIKKMDEMSEETLPSIPDGGMLSVPNKKEIFEILNETCSLEWNCNHVKLNKQYIRAESHHAAISKRKLTAKQHRSSDKPFAELNPLMISKMIRNSSKVYDDMIARKTKLYAEAKKKGMRKVACNVQAFDAALIAAKIAGLIDENSLSDAQIKKMKSKLGNMVLEGSIGELNDEFEKKYEKGMLDFINNDEE